MTKASLILCLVIIFCSLSRSGYNGVPCAKNFDLFIEAENARTSCGFAVEGPPRALGYSGNGFFSLWRTAAPRPPGYFANYPFYLTSAGNFYIVFWVQALDTPFTSPFELRLDKREWTISKKTAKPLPAQIRYGEDMTGYYAGPVALQPGIHNISIVVDKRRAYSDKAYSLLIDAIALTRRNPSNFAAPPTVYLTVDATGAAGSFACLTDLSQGAIAGVADPRFWAGIAPIIHDLGTSFVRIDHVFDDTYYGVVKKKADGSLHYDWIRLDAVVSEILKMGAKPFFCLSYMPGALSRDNTPYQAPAHLKEWQNLCRQLVVHMKIRFHLSGLCYEVWNEPDLKEFWKGSRSDYCELYRATVEAIKGADPTAKAGGPAVASVVDGWLSSFLQFVKNRKLPLDFVSWHLYSQDPAAYSSCTDYVRKTLSALKFPANVELLLTEWNSSGAVNASNDAFYNAGRTAAVLSLLGRENIAKAFFFMPKDARRAQPLYGGWGLVSSDGSPKPAYDCLDAYNRLRNGRKMRISSTDNSVGALGVIKDDTLELLLWNYSPEQPFGAPGNITISFNLAGTPFARGAIRQIEYLIDSRHSTIIENHGMPNLQVVNSKIFAGKRTVKETVSLENGGVMYLELHRRAAGVESARPKSAAAFGGGEAPRSGLQSRETPLPSAVAAP